MDVNNGLPQLPQGWVWTRLGEVAYLNPKLANDIPDELEVSFIPMKQVEELTGRVDLSFTKRYSEVKKGYTGFKNGDVIFAKITPCMENGKVGIINNLKNGVGFGSTEFHVIRLPNVQMPNRFAFFFVVRESFRRDARMYMTGTAGQLRVPKGYLEDISFPLPPLPEQHRIVAKIEELFTKLDAGLETLNRIKLQLRQYRQAVLKHAFEGKLTKEWREAHQDKMEPASALLKRIKEERERNAGGKHKELPTVDTSELPELPKEWAWARVGNICDLINGRAFKPKEWSIDGIPIIRIQNLNNINADFNYCTFKIEEKYVVNNGQLLFAWSGTPGTSFGAHIWNRGQAVLNQHIFKVEIQEDYFNKLFLMHLLNWNVTGFIKQAHGTAGLAHITKGKFQDSIVAIPPILEQHHIVEEIERCFSIADEIEKVVEQSIKQGERLRQSILKRAFEGKLVPQDPTDEPAEKLLERIKAERAGREVGKKSKGKVMRKPNTKQGRMV